MEQPDKSTDCSGTGDAEELCSLEVHRDRASRGAAAASGAGEGYYAEAQDDASDGGDESSRAHGHTSSASISSSADGTGGTGDTGRVGKEGSDDETAPDNDATAALQPSDESGASAGALCNDRASAARDEPLSAAPMTSEEAVVGGLAHPLHTCALAYFSASRNISHFTSTLRPMLCTSPTRFSPSALSNRYLAARKQTEFKIADFDKVFASDWLSSTQVVLGTKCNSLLILDVVSNKLLNIPTLRGSPELAPPFHSCGIHAIAINPSRTLLATGADNPNSIAVYRLPQMAPLCVFEGHKDWVFGIQWIDDSTIVSASRDGTLSTWSTNDAVARDALDDALHRQNVRDWNEEHNFPAIQQFPSRQPTAKKAQIISSMRDFYPSLSAKTTTPHLHARVRDVKYNHETKTVFSLTTSGHVHLWDACLNRAVHTVALQNAYDTVCSAVDIFSGLYAVGSQNRIVFVDPRMSQPAFTTISMDCGYGTRSLAFNDSVLTVGSGAGSIAFFDVGARAFLNISTGSKCTMQTVDEATLGYSSGTDSALLSPSLDTNPLDYLLQSGSGWLLPEAHTQAQPLPSEHYFHAIYSIAYNPSGTRFLAAGGPLHSPISGGYVGLWQ